MAEAVERGHEVSLLNSAQLWLPYKLIGRGLFGIKLANLTVDSCDIEPVAAFANGSLRLIISFPVLFFRSCVMAARADIVVGYNPTAYSGLPAWLAARLARKPLVLDDADLVAMYDTTHRIRGGLEKFLLRRRCLIVCLSEAWADHLRHNLRTRGNVVVISNGADPSVFAACKNVDRRAARARWGFHDHEAIVVYAGSTWLQSLPGRGVIDLQGVDTLLEAFVEVVNRLPNARLLLLGASSSDLQHLPRHIRERVLLAGSYSTGDETHLSAFAAADSLALPGADCATYRYFDRFKAYEYLASGRPIVSVDLPVMREIFTSHARYYLPENAKSLADVLLGVLEGQGSEELNEVAYPEKLEWSVLAGRFLDEAEGVVK